MTKTHGRYYGFNMTLWAEFKWEKAMGKGVSSGAKISTHSEQMAVRAYVLGLNPFQFDFFYSSFRILFLR